MRITGGVEFGRAVAFLLLAMCAFGQETPAAFFAAHLKRVAEKSENYLNIPANVSPIASEIGSFIGKAQPTDAADLDHWAAPNSGPDIADLPLVWSTATKKFEVQRDELRTSSDAVVHFTWIFLRAYDALEKTLRESGSALAMGMASLVAAESVYRTNWAYLPLGLHDAAAFANFLVLGEQTLPESSLSGGRDDRGRLIARALNNVCPATISSRTDIVRQIQDEPLFATSTRDRPEQLEQWRKACGQALRADQIGLIHNLTIRALALEKAPAGAGDPARCTGDSWGCRLQTLLRELAEELKPEDEYRNSMGLAPDIRVAVTKSDPTVLIPLLVATAPFAFAPRYKEAKEQMGQLTGSSVENKEAAGKLRDLILGALKGYELTTRILSLAGSEPEFTVYRKSADKVAIALTWRNMARIEPVARGELLTEQVYLELVDTVPGPKPAEGPARSEGGGGQKPPLPLPPTEGEKKAAEGDLAPRPGLGGGGGGGGASGFGEGGEGFGFKGVGPRPGDNPGNVTPPLANPGEKSPDPARVEPPGTDPIQIPPAGRAELDARAQELRRAFASEQAGVQVPDASRLLAYLDSTDWRQGPVAREWLPQKLDEFLELRQHFLHVEGGPYASRLTSILRGELYLAAWLWETRATTTAELLLRDMVELAVYAGTEPGRAPDRLWRLDLPLTLAFPSLVRGEAIPPTGARMPIGLPAREAIVNWSVGRLSNPTSGEEVSLDDLYAGWTEGQYDRPPYLGILSPFERAESQPEWTKCPGGRLCRWYFFGEGRVGPTEKRQEKRP